MSQLQLWFSNEVFKLVYVSLLKKNHVLIRRITRATFLHEVCRLFTHAGLVVHVARCNIIRTLPGFVMQAVPSIRPNLFTYEVLVIVG